MKNAVALHFTHTRSLEPQPAHAAAVRFFEVLTSVARSISHNAMTHVLILGIVVVVPLVTII